MRIHCDLCGAEIEEKDALPSDDDEEDVEFFCSQKCLEKALEGHERFHGFEVDERE
jgi:hypothetical protein